MDGDLQSVPRIQFEMDGTKVAVWSGLLPEDEDLVTLPDTLLYEVEQQHHLGGVLQHAGLVITHDILRLPVKRTTDTSHICIKLLPTGACDNLRHRSTYPLVGDDLTGPLLQLVETELSNRVGVFQGFGLLTGRVGRTSCRSCGSDVFQVQVLLAGQVLLL